MVGHDTTNESENQMTPPTTNSWPVRLAYLAAAVVAFAVVYIGQRERASPGRRIFDNLKKAIAYLLAVHVPIAGLALLPLLFGLPILFGPIHIAFLEMVIDPVCGMTVDPATAKHSLNHAGATYYFCCPHCAEKFKGDPQKYLKPPARPASSSKARSAASSGASRSGSSAARVTAPGSIQRSAASRSRAGVSWATRSR